MELRIQTSPGLLDAAYSVLLIKLLFFSVTPFKIDQSKRSKPFNRLSLESGNRKKVDMQRLSPRFRSQQVFLWELCGKTFFSKVIEICMETPSPVPGLSFLPAPYRGWTRAGEMSRSPG